MHAQVGTAKFSKATSVEPECVGAVVVADNDRHMAKQVRDLRLEEVDAPALRGPPPEGLRVEDRGAAFIEEGGDQANGVA